MRKIYQWLRGDGPLVRIGWAIGGMLALAVAIAAVVTVVGAQVLDIHGTKTEPLSATTLYDLLKIAFAVAAGIGGVIALVTAYRRQQVAEFAQALAEQQHDLAGRTEERAAQDSEQERELAKTRLLNERFTTAAGQLGDDKPAVRLAGVYAMAGLADDWPDQRQTCIDVLCAYLRMPYDPDPGDGAPAADRQAFWALREVRRTVIRVITAHLQPGHRRASTAQDWRGLDLDFTGTVFDGGSFRGAEFTGGTVTFADTEFTGGTISFYGAEFTGGTVRFVGARFSGGEVGFDGAEFSGGRVTFADAKFTGGTISFHAAEFSGGRVSFRGAKFTGGTISFRGAEFTGGRVTFADAKFTGGTISFDDAEFSGGEVSFRGVQFSGGEISFDGAEFTGGEVSFGGARFTGSTVGFAEVREWQVPPRFDWTAPPPGVTLPSSQTAS